MSELHCPACGHHIGTLKEATRPPAAKRATSDYMGSAIELVDLFLREEKMRPTTGDRIESRALREAFESWCAAGPYPVLSAQAFGRALRSCGLMPLRSNGVRMYTGARLKD